MGFNARLTSGEGSIKKLAASICSKSCYSYCLKFAKEQSIKFSVYIVVKRFTVASIIFALQILQHCTCIFLTGIILNSIEKWGRFFAYTKKCYIFYL